LPYTVRVVTCIRDFKLSLGETGASWYQGQVDTSQFFLLTCCCAYTDRLAKISHAVTYIITYVNQSQLSIRILSSVF